MADWYMKCHYCQTPKPDLRRCTRCYYVYYCSSVCQRLDWPLHSKSCNQTSEEGGEINRNQTHEEGSERQQHKDTTGTCNKCSISGCTLRCAKCKDIFYCSKACQRLDWKSHKKTCKSEAQIVPVNNTTDTKDPKLEEEKMTDTTSAAGDDDVGNGENADKATVDPTVTQSTVGTCNGCAVRGNHKQCARCRSALYCSKECQVRDWASHKKVCTKMSREVRKEDATENIVLTEDEKRVIAERNRIYEYKKKKRNDFLKLEESGMHTFHMYDFSGSPMRFHSTLTPEKLRVFKRAPVGSLEMAILYAKTRLPGWNIIRHFHDIPPEFNFLVALSRQYMANVLVAFMFMYHNHVMRHGVYLKDASDKITHVEFYFDHLEDDPFPYFSYDQIKPGSYILIKNPVMHLFGDGQVGLRINHPAEVLIYNVGLG